MQAQRTDRVVHVIMRWKCRHVNPLTGTLKP